MGVKKSKKKAQAGQSRGFATTSTPAKSKEISRAQSPELLKAALSTDEAIPCATELTLEEEELLARAAENNAVVELGDKLFTRLSAEIEVEKRARKTSIHLSLPEDLIFKIINLHTERVCVNSPTDCAKTETLKFLYTAELLLSKLGLDDDLIKQVLMDVHDVTTLENFLYNVILNHSGNVDYDIHRPKNDKSEKVEAEGPAMAPNSRMSELLSDEEDQAELEADPNSHYVNTQLELLSLRAKLKKHPDCAEAIDRLEKRCRVIQNQLGFNKATSSAEVKRLVKEGYLQQLSSITTLSSHSARPRMSKHLNSKGSDDVSDDGWMSIQPTSGNSSVESFTSSSMHTPPLQASQLPDSIQHTPPIALEDEIIPLDMFELSEVPTQVTTSSETTSLTLEPFPIALPKSSQNISPVKLLQTYLKRIDKQAKEDFDLTSHTLTLRFSSAKVDRRLVVVEDHQYSFPDEDTAKNFLSMKALFSVPELASDKAGTRFSGPFRRAWQLLEDAEQEIQKVRIAQKVQNVRNIYEERQSTIGEVSEEGNLLPITNPVPVQSFNRYSAGDSGLQIVQMWDHLRNSEAYANMYQYRNTLPIAAYRDALLESVSANQVTILCGETGCGKSTQLPAYILEDALNNSKACKIYVTEPRRISAISLATRVSAELGEYKNAIAHGDSLLGFSIRLDSQVSDQSRLIYATTGIVLRMLEDNSNLRGITHLILDEVHERSIESDFLLIVVKRLLRERRDLRVILMSATLDAERFNEYFGGHCCIFNVPGRTFPVEQYFLEDAIEVSQYVCDENGYYARRGTSADINNSWEVPDEQEEINSEEALVTYSERTIRAMKLLDPYKVNYDLICILLDYLVKSMDRSMTQAILIFLPGMGEIRRLLDLLQAHNIFGDHRKWVVYALHSSIANEKQQAAFDIPPRGMRKIVIATNIAETGITIPDITCVIDSGKHKESRFDARRQLNKLVETYISKANARQRMGRAGRVQPGMCFHLFSKARHEKMAEHQLPEFQRLNLDDLALRVKTVRMGGIEEVLLEALDAPTPENVKRSINSLIEVGALDDKQDLTALGRHLAKLPVDITLGKLILYGVRYACLDPCLVVAASLSSKSPFETTIGHEREANNAKQHFVRGESDFLTVWTAYTKWRTVCQENPRHEFKFCKDSFLNSKNLGAIEELRLQYIKILADNGLITITESEKRSLQRARFANSRDGFVGLPLEVCKNERSPTFIELCLASAFYPNLINVEDGFRTISKGQAVTIHPSSINYHNQNFSKRWMTFFGLLKTKVATHAHETGLVDDYIVALFCGSHIEVRPYSGTISLDHNRIRFMTRDLRTLVAISLLRKNLDEQFAAFLDHQVVKPAWLDILQDVVQVFEAVARQKLR